MRKISPLGSDRGEDAARAALPFVVGDTVLVDGNSCVVRFIGRVQRKGRWTRSLYVGAEFDKPIGNTNGTLEGVVYFSCPPRHGVFVQPSLVSTPSLMALEEDIPLDKSENSDDEQLAFGIWNVLDQFGEQQALNQSKHINLLDQEMARQSSLDDLSSESDSLGSQSKTMSFHQSTFNGRRASSLSLSQMVEEPTGDTYEGPQFDDVPDMKFAIDLLSHYRDHPYDLLPRRYVAYILLHIEELLSQTVTSAVVRLEAPKTSASRLVLVGDTHGQLNDVLWIFFKFGVPSAETPYLFNGDIADRGHFAVEIFLLLFAFKLACPESVHINRGNHESFHMNEIYGFGREVCQKYGRSVYLKFQDIFNLLPLCTVIDDRVIVLHGGLFREDGISIEDIKKLDYHRPCPTSPETDADRMMFDVLWSDPQAEPGRGPSGRGQDCVSFGPDVTWDFLTSNQLELCIRSHQVPKTLRGFDSMHDGKCITLFSASNYCGTSGNLGGVLIFDAKLSFEVHEYMSPTMQEVQAVYNETKWATEKIKRMAPAVQDLVNRLESRAKRRSRRRDLVAQMSKIICEKKPEIWDKFWESDTRKEGILTATQISTCFADLLQYELPWGMLIHKLKIIDADGNVNYNDFLQRFRVEFRPKEMKHTNWRLETVRQVFESMMKADLTLRETLLVFDRNADGTVSYREFEELLTELKCGLSRPQVRLLMRIITAHYVTSAAGDCRVDVGEFLGRFKVVYDQAVQETEIADDSKWIPNALQVIGRYILADKAEAAERYYMGHTLLTFTAQPPTTERRRSSALRSVALLQKFCDYTKVLPDNDDLIQDEGFIRAIRQLPISAIEGELGYPLDDDRLIRLARYVDISGTGHINYLEFLNAFHIEDRHRKADVAEQLWQQICSTFYRQRIPIERALSHFDPEATGRVTPDDFRSALDALNSVLGHEAPLSASQVELITASIDCDQDGRIDYESFLDSFVIVDLFPVDLTSEAEPSVDFAMEDTHDNEPAKDDDDTDMDVEEQQYRHVRDKLASYLEDDDSPPPPSLEDLSGLLLDYVKNTSHDKVIKLLPPS